MNNLFFTKNIRKTFIDFFIKNNHTHVTSSPVVLSNDPSIMFVNSGMVQFKDVFTGKRASESQRVTTHQKCIRAGGKHNDLENVGYTNRHHTFFEMLGNFSFGDYFKEKAILYAWQLLTQTYQIDPKKLLVTIHQSDQESELIWKKITGFSDEKIIKINTEDNFWSMGTFGPCGPCTEIFYDYGPKVQGGPPGSKNQDGERFVEIWNIVFMEFDKKLDGTISDLTQKSIDTGMGIERIACVLQNVHNNYETDIFKALIESATTIYKKPKNDETKISYKVISDHIRSISFMIADGIIPSNESRGYVLRRIMRRAMRHTHTLDEKSCNLHMMVEPFTDLMMDVYPELKRTKNLIKEIIFEEEQKFKNTLDRGIKRLHLICKNLRQGDIMPGNIAFELYDTYGFPIDLTQDILRPSNIKINVKEFDREMRNQKIRSKTFDKHQNKQEDFWIKVLEKVGPSKFVDNKLSNNESLVLFLSKEGCEEDEIDETECLFTLLVNETPFYAESGGQVGDTGIIKSSTFTAQVLDTKKILGKLHVHFSKLLSGSIRVGQKISMHVDQKRRKLITNNHSATHILHEVLRQILSNNITQKGSLVDAEKLRLDFNYNRAISKKEKKEIEKRVNQVIIANAKTIESITSLENALDEGVLALFGEKYEKNVRVISMNKEKECFSKELCGGTHVNYTGEIGNFKILNETSISSGIRRIEAVTGKKALEHHQKVQEILEEVSNKLCCSENELVVKIQTLLSQVQSLKSQNNSLQINSISKSASEIENIAVHVGNVVLLLEFLQKISPDILRNVALKNANNSTKAIIILISENNKKFSIVVSVSKEISKKISAKYVLSKVANILKCPYGGGSESIAQTGTETMNKSILELQENLIQDLKKDSNFK